MEMLDLEQLFRNRHKCSFVRFYSEGGWGTGVRRGGGGRLNSQLKSETHTSLCKLSA